MKLYDYTLYDMINRSALCWDKKTAWHEADTKKDISFGKYKKDTESLAAGLIEKGIKKKDRIAVIAKNSYEYFVVYGAAAAIGAIVLPVNWRLSEDEISFILNDCEPVIIFLDKEYSKITDNLNLNFSYESFYFESDIEKLINKATTLPSQDVSADDGFVIIHTAAVEGEPRGALLSHSNLFYALTHISQALKLTRNDSHLNLLPLFHIAGLSLAFTALHRGSLNINLSSFNALKAAELIEEKNASFMFDFSPILNSIMEEAEKNNKNIKSLRAIIGLDAPDTIKKYQDMTGGSFYSIYGQTETSAIATISKYDDMPGSAGRTVTFANIQIVDEYDNVLPIDSTGEIVVRGPIVFKGYWNREKDNEYAFREGWHHTGDMGSFDKNGFLWYKGRTPEKELIKPGGDNVYPAEVEKTIMQHEKVDSAVVFGVPDPKWKEAIKAVCQIKKGETITKKELSKFVANKIASYKKPQHIEFINKMPLKDDGTIDRNKVKKKYQSSDK